MVSIEMASLQGNKMLMEKKAEMILSLKNLLKMMDSLSVINKMWRKRQRVTII